MSIDNNKNDPLNLGKMNLKKRRSIHQQKPDSELVQIFWAAPIEAFFGQDTIAAVTNKSTKTLESDRWRGLGIPYRKIGGRVLYQKQDVIHWLESHELMVSTSQVAKKNEVYND